MKVKLENGFAKVEVSNNKKLIVSFYNGTYDLTVHSYNHKNLMIGEICMGVKRISTINKYAQNYGIEFVA